jgi:hypothetical protein
VNVGIGQVYWWNPGPEMSVEFRVDYLGTQPPNKRIAWCATRNIVLTDVWSVPNFVTGAGRVTLLWLAENTTILLNPRTT